MSAEPNHTRAEASAIDADNDDDQGHGRVEPRSLSVIKEVD